MRTPVTTNLSDLEARVLAGEALSRGDFARVLASIDLISVGMLGEAARKRLSGDDITFGRVLELSAGPLPVDCGAAGEVRLVGTPASLEDACGRVREAVAFAAGVPLTGFAADELLALCGHDHLALADAAAALRAAGLEAIATCPIDRFASTDETIDIVRAVQHGGLGAWRLTVDHAPLGERLALAERAAVVQRETGAIRAFAPLPRRDPPEVPSTGYDDVRSITVARLVCRDIRYVQVDWPLYGPKLAQVALAYGTNDVDGIAAVDAQHLGARRAPHEEIVRQIRAAAGVPVERNGRFERLS